MRILLTLILLSFACVSYAHSRCGCTNYTKTYTRCAPKVVGYTYVPAGYTCPQKRYHPVAFYRYKKCYYPRDYRATEVRSCRTRGFNRFPACSWVTPLSVEHYCRR